MPKSSNAGRRTLVSWSSGKDSAWMLHVLRQRDDVEVVGLLTTINERSDRVAVHAVRRELLRAQAAAACLPLTEVTVPELCSNAEYEAAMGGAFAAAKARGVECVAFGDLFLQDIRTYREKQFEGSGLEPLFPLFGLPTRKLAEQMIAAGLRARITCVDTQQLDARFAGREFDEALLADLPANIDPCGENGEFHTVAYAGPMFRAPIDIVSGAIDTRGRFVYADVLMGS